MQMEIKQFGKQSEVSSGPKILFKQHNAFLISQVPKFWQSVGDFGGSHRFWMGVRNMRLTLNGTVEDKLEQATRFERLVSVEAGA